MASWLARLCDACHAAFGYFLSCKLIKRIGFDCYCLLGLSFPLLPNAYYTKTHNPGFRAMTGSNPSTFTYASNCKDWRLSKAPSLLNKKGPIKYVVSASSSSSTTLFCQEHVLLNIWVIMNSRRLFSKLVPLFHLRRQKSFIENVEERSSCVRLLLKLIFFGNGIKQISLPKPANCIHFVGILPQLLMYNPNPLAKEKIIDVVIIIIICFWRALSSSATGIGGSSRAGTSMLMLHNLHLDLAYK